MVPLANTNCSVVLCGRRCLSVCWFLHPRIWFRFKGVFLWAAAACRSGAPLERRRWPPDRAPRRPRLAPCFLPPQCSRGALHKRLARADEKCVDKANNPPGDDAHSEVTTRSSDTPCTRESLTPLPLRTYRAQSRSGRRISTACPFCGGPTMGPLNDGIPPRWSPGRLQVSRTPLKQAYYAFIQSHLEYALGGCGWGDHGAEL